MSGFWQATAAATPLTVAPSSAAAAVNAGTVIRIRALETQAAGAVITISDSNLGTVWQMTPAAAGMITLAGIDIRGSPGGTLTIANTGAAGINAQGDFIPIGYPYGMP